MENPAHLRLVLQHWCGMLNAPFSAPGESMAFSLVNLWFERNSQYILPTSPPFVCRDLLTQSGRGIAPVAVSPVLLLLGHRLRTPPPLGALLRPLPSSNSERLVLQRPNKSGRAGDRSRKVSRSKSR